MTKRSLQVLIALTLLSASSYAAKERVIRFQNHVRVGYDDNVYQTDKKNGSAFVSEIINLSAKLNFSSRTDALLYWEPEFMYRPDSDPKLISYQNLYVRLNHALSQRAFLTLSDRFRYQQREGQSDGVGQYNQNYIENDLKGAIDYTLNDVSFLKLGAGYKFRIWDDESYGEWNSASPKSGNNFDKIDASGSYLRQLTPNKTQILGGAQYSNLSYDGERGGFDSSTLFAGVDQNFSPTVSGFGRLGYTFATIDQSNGGSEDSSSPYMQAGLEVNSSAQTSFTSSMGYTLSRSENSIYNAQDKFNLGLGVRHDFTQKINVSANFAYIYSMYDGSYSADGSTVSDADDQFMTLGLRCAYEINRNNFVEAGYLYRTRMVSGGGGALTEWDGNRIDVAWRLRL